MMGNSDVKCVCLLACSQNGTSEEVKKIVSTLNDRKVASADVVGIDLDQMFGTRLEILYLLFGRFPLLLELE